MPTMDTTTQQDQARPPLLKLLLAGDSKAGKTYYAGLAARYNLNVLYADGDVGAPTIGSMVRDGTLTQEQAARIFLMDMRDKVLAGDREPTFWDDMFSFISATKGFIWNDDEARTATRKDHDKELFKIDTSKLDHNTVLILDSWTALTESIMMKCAGEAGVDLTSATTSDMRPVYQGASLRATELLRIIRSLPCHCIVLAHPDEYQHKVAPEGKKVGAVSERDLLIAYTKKIPKTTSKPQGLQMGKYFTDVAWIGVNANGSKRMIDFTPNPDRIGGGHLSGNKDIEEYNISALINAIGGQIPREPQPMHWLTRLAPGEAFPPPPVLDGTKKPVAQGSGLQGFNVKKPA